jgi:hypothetical protein
MNKYQKQEYISTLDLFMKDTTNKSIRTLDMIQILDTLHRYETLLTNLNTRACNGEIEDSIYEKKTNNIEEKVKIIAESLGFGISFNHDPRGASICFILPSKKYNSWDGETWRLFW